MYAAPSVIVLMVLLTIGFGIVAVFCLISGGVALKRKDSFVYSMRKRMAWSGRFLLSVSVACSLWTTQYVLSLCILESPQPNLWVDDVYAAITLFALDDIAQVVVYSVKMTLALIWLCLLISHDGDTLSVAKERFIFWGCSILTLLFSIGLAITDTLRFQSLGGNSEVKIFAAAEIFRAFWYFSQVTILAVLTVMATLKLQSKSIVELMPTRKMPLTFAALISLLSFLGRGIEHLCFLAASYVQDENGTNESHYEHMVHLLIAQMCLNFIPLTIMALAMHYYVQKEIEKQQRPVIEVDLSSEDGGGGYAKMEVINE